MTKNNHLHSMNPSGKSSPDVVEIHPTDWCNHDCIWCIAHDERDGVAEFSNEQLVFLLNDMAKMGIKCISYSGGGDPLQFKYIEDALLLTKSLGMEARLVTNGSGLNHSLMNAIADSCTSVRISLDASSASTHYDLHRPKEGADRFDTIIDNCKRLIKLVDPEKARIGFSFIAYPKNIDEVESFIDLAYDVGANFVDLKYNFFMSEKTNLRLRNEAERIMNEHSAVREGKLSLSIDKFIPRRDLSKEISAKAPWLLLNHFAVITANGDVYPCCHLIGESPYLEGNVIAKGGFKKVWFSEERRIWKAKVEKSNLRCRVCMQKDRALILSHLYKEQKMDLTRSCGRL